MQRFWTLPDGRSGPSLEAATAGLLLALPEQASPAQAMLAFVNRWAPVDYISLVEHGGDAPWQLEGRAARPDLSHVTGECFTAYRHRHFRRDDATRLAARLRGQGKTAPVTALHLCAEDLPCPSWCDEVYRHRRLADRLSFLYSPGPGRAVSVNLYRHQARGPLGDGELDRLLALGPLLAQAHRLALRLQASLGEGPATQVARALQRLAEQAPLLTAREREVCARIACGLSADGIAVELDIAPSTVASLRKRAYAKLAELGIHGGRLRLARWLG
jgi:DNA-binding CsgD family transcriptional regulator